jgi:hypothetical protein
VTQTTEAVTGAFLQAMREVGLPEHPGGQCPAPGCQCALLADVVEARACEILGIAVSCAAAQPLRAGGWAACGQPGTAVWEYACVHEHVRRQPTCDDHAPEPGAVGCKACWDAGHECPMAFRQVSP